MLMADTFVILLTGLSILNGCGLVNGLRRYGMALEWWEQLCFGAVVGLAGLSLSGLVVVGIASLSGAGEVLWLTLWLIEAGLFVLLVRSGLLDRSAWLMGTVRIDWPSLKRSRGDLFWYGFWVLLFVQVTRRVIDFDAGGVTTAPATNYGDLAFHLSVISSFAFGGNFPPENPIFAGVSFTYPFLVDLLTASMVGLGSGWKVAFMMSSLPLLVGLVGVVESLGHRLTGRRWVGRLALILLVFNGGLGFLSLANDLRLMLREGGVLGSWVEIAGFLSHLPETSTINNSVTLAGVTIPIRYGNPLTTLLIPQRSLMFGLPVVGMIIILWHRTLTQVLTEAERWRTMIVAGVMTGLLPLLHTHGFLAVMIVTLPMLLIYRRPQWLGFLAAAGLVGGLPVLWLSRTGVRRSLFTWQPGWESGGSDVLLFWVVNNGPFLGVLMAMMSVLWWKRAELAPFLIPFMLWFIIPNLVLLAPWVWDNMKMFVYWAMVSSIAVGMGIERLTASRRGIIRAAGLVLLVLMVLSGLLDVWRGLSPVESVRLLTGDDLRVAELIRERTPARALVLHAPVHNSPLILTGRRSLMGYSGHLWSHGLDYVQREAEVEEMLRPGSSGALLLAHGVDYVLVDEDDEVFRGRYPLVFSEGGRRLYRVGKD